MRKTHSTLEIILTSERPYDSKYSTDTLVKGRRVFLYGLPVHIMQTDHEVQMSPVYPFIKRLIELIKANPEVNHYIWEDKQWRIDA